MRDLSYSETKSVAIPSRTMDSSDTYLCFALPSCRGSVVGVGLVLGVATSEPMLVGAMRAEATPQIGFLLAALALQSSPPVRSLDQP